MYTELERAIGCYHPSIQELLVVDDLLSALVGIEGRYVSIKSAHDKSDAFRFTVHVSMDLALQEQAKRIFPLCGSFLLIIQFIESRLKANNSGLVNHAFSSALRSFLLEYQALIAQLEHQFRLRRLTIQGLWFHCQPMMSPLQALSSIVKHASTNAIMGSGILDLLQHRSKAMAGDPTVRTLLEKVTDHASTPYLAILEKWIYEGVIDDPHGEFFIQENAILLKESPARDMDGKYWSERYVLKEGVLPPTFLSSSAHMILMTGRYLNVMSECGHHVHIPSSERAKMVSLDSTCHHPEYIRTAHDFASTQLLNLINGRYDIMSKLRSIKRYLLIDQGDFLVHFMDTARDELAKPVGEIFLEKLQSLMDLTVSDPSSHGELVCSLESSPFIQETVKDSSDHATGIEAFSLNVKVEWPLSIVLSADALGKYQSMFRFLFHCKHVERQLSAAWQVHQNAHSRRVTTPAVFRSSLLCRAMLKFINSLLHYLTFEVIEPNWHAMCARLQQARCIDEVIQWHDAFLNKCMRECLFLLPEILKRMECATVVCLQYAAAARRLLTSSVTEILDSSGKGMVSITHPTFIESILKFEDSFTAHLHGVSPLLSSQARGAPFLSHLLQWIFGSHKAALI